MKPNWKMYDSEEKSHVVYILGIRTVQESFSIFYRARIEVTADFDGMLGKKGFEYMKFAENWTEIDGFGKFGLREDEYKYIDEGVY